MLSRLQSCCDVLVPFRTNLIDYCRQISRYVFSTAQIVMDKIKSAVTLPILLFKSVDDFEIIDCEVCLFDWLQRLFWFLLLEVTEVLQKKPATGSLPPLIRAPTGIYWAFEQAVVFGFRRKTPFRVQPPITSSAAPFGKCYWDLALSRKGSSPLYICLSFSLYYRYFYFLYSGVERDSGKVC